MTADQKESVLEQIDSALGAFRELRAKSKYDDLSDMRGHASARVITIIASTIQRIAPRGSTYQVEADRVMKVLGTTNGNSLQYLPGILEALRSDIENDYLRSISELIHADVFSDFLETAHYLLNEGYKESAAVLTGGVLEEQLRKMAQKNALPTETNSRPLKADQLNASLARANVYGVLDQKSITAWLDLRNKAAHGKHDEYTKEQVALMLAGVRDFRCEMPRLTD